ncbi:hydroxymethylbilane synthase [Janibacter cremeus]|uniref:hydroxymethylbilane synthase n=1 Tax=Janibacter cremeus TaxID=1285192 RepID=UPI0023F8AEC0|nr:hydroxymethylbilane synthase [Janibacter cremeus]WEV76692.1 hydroxymethylbilane synthase [Janibacter cremeus]
MTTLRLGTRRSKLAMTQSGHVADALRAEGHDVEIVEIVTEGDTSRASLASMGGHGVFASALREALLAGEIDIAVHSLKDLPTRPEPGLVVAAIPTRVDPRDALCARDGLTLGELGEGAVIGTGSPRRRAQLACLGRGFEFRDIRGNLGTRLDMVGSGEDQLDAVILAHAGLTRSGLQDRVTEVLEPIQMICAPGQGALAVECREEDEQARAALRPIDDADARAATTAERGVLAELGAGCAAPVGALAEVVEDIDGPIISLRAVVAATDGSGELRRSITGPIGEAEDLGRRLARTLVADGAPALADLSATHPTTASEHAQ